MSLPKKLLADFDEVLKERGYQSRSKGIRDALQDYIVRHQWMNEMEGERIGIITIIYRSSLYWSYGKSCRYSTQFQK